ncbi:hypothetical protein AANUM_0407 [Aggregatibacter actinomycetemcomitans NUM4039]|nr:hypothetical protein [Aggregatibacter actinomycetemcomitans]BAS47638.1 hypothetical protein AANUM_0407 [Aggregatibacter actinomycetemcomitans NUM4039]
MQLRQGFVYIYAHTKHRLFSTDDKGKWLVFRYVTNNDDANSASDFEQLSHGKNAGLNACFYFVNGVRRVQMETGLLDKLIRKTILVLHI